MAEKNLTDTDMNPSDPDVTSMTRRGEDVIKEEGPERGRRPNEGTKGESDRPYGGADSESGTGVDPKPNIAEDMPDMTTGDQGG